jgi:hypothetical protein
MAFQGQTWATAIHRSLLEVQHEIVRRVALMRRRAEPSKPATIGALTSSTS